MTLRRWMQQNTARLDGKTVAVTGTTGGLGRALCHHLAGLGANLLLLDRNPDRSHAFRRELQARHPGITVVCHTLELEDMDSVCAVAAILRRQPPDVFIHNAGAYSIPRRVCSSGYDNVFQINFLSPYYLIRTLLDAVPHTVVVGSIAHTYAPTDPADVDFRTRRQASLAYGNAKRHLMYALYGLFREQPAATVSVTHPGISFTNITNHYPKVIFALIKHPMKVLFMRPNKACLSILRGVFEPCRGQEWIGPRWWDIWGLPRKKPLRTATPGEAAAIAVRAEKIYTELQNRWSVDAYAQEAGCERTGNTQPAGAAAVCGGGPGL